MSRVLLRHERILPGPLKILQRSERRSPVPITPLVLASAAITAGLLLMPQLSPRVSVDPTPLAELAGASHAVPVAVVDAPMRSRSAAAAPATTGSVTPLPVAASAGTAAPVRTDVAAKPAADMSLFQLDQLTVLQDNVSGLDPSPPPAIAPQRASAKSPSRRPTAAKGASPTQP